MLFATDSNHFRGATKMAVECNYRMTQNEWLEIFLGDIECCPSAVSLRRWAVNYAEEIKGRCPDHVDQIRERYKTRLGELRDGNRV